MSLASEGSFIRQSFEFSKLGSFIRQSFEFSKL